MGQVILTQFDLNFYFYEFISDQKHEYLSCVLNHSNCIEKKNFPTWPKKLPGGKIRVFVLKLYIA